MKEDNTSIKELDRLLKMVKKQLEEEKGINSDWFIQEISNQLRFLDREYGYIHKNENCNEK